MDDNLITSVLTTKLLLASYISKKIHRSNPAAQPFVCLSCCPFVSFIVPNAPPPSQSLLPFFPLSPSLCPPCHLKPSPLCVCVLIWPCLAWIAVGAHLDRAQLVLPLKAECHYRLCLLSVLSACLSEGHILIMILALILRFLLFQFTNFPHSCMFFIFCVASLFLFS